MPVMPGYESEEDMPSHGLSVQHVGQLVIGQARVVCVEQGGLWRLTGQQIAGAAAE